MKNKYRHFGSAIVLKHGGYIVGGWGRTERNSSEFLATGSSVWTQGPDVPTLGVRMSCAVKLSDTEFVILGGYDDQTQALHYSETKKMWTEWPRLTHGVYGHSCVRLGDKILVAGGPYSKGVRTVIYDTKTGSAREVASLKHRRYRSGMVVYKG